MLSQKNNLKNAVIYHVMIDRFAGFPKNAKDSGENWIGGTIKGIEQKLPYLSRLGVTALRLSSPFNSTGYHGYSIIDLERIDPHFGTVRDLKRLVKKAHARGILIFIDYIATHCSDQHPFFKSAIRSKNGPYRQWFSFKQWPTSYAKFLNYYNALPKWNLNNPAVRTYLTQNAISWIRKTNCDGFFIDHAIGAPNKFWKKFNRQMKRAYPQTLLIGEVWFDDKTNPHTLPSIEMTHAKELFRQRRQIQGGVQDAAMHQYIDVFDGCLDITANQLIYACLIRHRFSKQTLLKKLRAHYQRFPGRFLLPTFLDSHDVPRFLFEAKNQTSVLQEASRIQFQTPQPMIIYYGTEIGMTQRKIWLSEHGNQEARRKMIWNPKRQNRELLAWYQKLGKQRAEKM